MSRAIRVLLLILHTSFKRYYKGQATAGPGNTLLFSSSDTFDYWNLPLWRPIWNECSHVWPQRIILTWEAWGKKQNKHSTALQKCDTQAALHRRACRRQIHLRTKPPKLISFVKNKTEKYARAAQEAINIGKGLPLIFVCQESTGTRISIP